MTRYYQALIGFVFAAACAFLVVLCVAGCPSDGDRPYSCLEYAKIHASSETESDARMQLLERFEKDCRARISAGERICVANVIGGCAGYVETNEANRSGVR